MTASATRVNGGTRARRTRAAIAALFMGGLAGAHAAAAAESTAPAPVTAYPLVARVRVTPDARALRYEHDPRVPGAPPNAAVTVDVLAQTSAAYRVVASRLFDGGTAGEIVELDVWVRSAGIQPRGEWWAARVEHDVVLRSAAGAAIAGWSLDGEARLRGIDARDVPEAFKLAARRAAGRLERELEASPAVRAFLAERGIGPRAVAPPEPQAPPRERGKRVAFVEGGTGLATGAGQSGVGLALRGGVSGQRLLAQVTLDGWWSSFEANPAFGRSRRDASLDAFQAGLDLGLEYRPSRAFEWRGGIGFHVVHGRAVASYEVVTTDDRRMESTISMSTWGTTGSVFAGFAFAPGTRLLPRVGLEVRRYVGRPLDFEALRREVAPAGTSFMVLLGTERPVWSGGQEARSSP